MSRNGAPSLRRVARSRAGFTLVELLVAMMILSIGILGLAASAMFVTRQMGGGKTMTSAAALGQSRVELLRARNCTAITSSNAPVVTNGIAVSWTVGNIVSSTRSIAVTVSYPTKYGQRTQTFRSTVPCGV